MKKLNILYEDKYLLIVNKPTRLLTISTNKEKEKTIYHEVYNYLHKKNQKVFIVNRIDKDTSGIVAFAKDPETKRIMQANWEKCIRKYYAVVIGKIKEKGKIENYLYEGKDLKTYITSDPKKGKYALTLYEPKEKHSAYTLLDIEIKTGRKNQIRAGLASINHPIIGDKKYEAKKNPLGRLGLHSYYLSFIHPKTKQKIEVETKLPTEFKKIFETK